MDVVVHILAIVFYTISIVYYATALALLVKKPKNHE